MPAKVCLVKAMVFPETVLKQDTLLLYNPKECRGNPFLLLENSRPLSTWGPLNFLSTCLGIYFLACSPRDSQESSPAPQFKSINSSSLSFLYSSTLKDCICIYTLYKVYLFKTMIFPVVMYGCDSWTIKKAEH